MTATLLEPIPGTSPAGEWLRFDPLYDEIRRLRDEDDPRLPQGVWKRELKRADWKGVAEQTARALATRSKDLQLAVWFAEAGLHLGGYAGFAEGIRMTAELCRRFWAELYPPLEGESIELRSAPLVWAAEKLLLPLESVRVTNPEGEEVPPMTWADRKLALYYDNLAKQHSSEAAQVYDGAEVTYSQFLISASLTPGEWYVSLARDATEARAAIADLQGAFAEQAGAENTPSFARLLDTLEAVTAFASRIAEERGCQAGPEIERADETSAPLLPEPGSPITSRGEAFQRLREAADFLFRTEPHSPVPYLITRAVSWEHLPLPDLLAELLQKSDLAAVYALLGLQHDTER